MGWLRNFRAALPRTYKLDSTLSEAESHALGRYNAERWRGLVHTPEKDAEMAELQARFNAEFQP